MQAGSSGFARLIHASRVLELPLSLAARVYFACTMITIPLCPSKENPSVFCGLSPKVRPSSSQLLAISIQSGFPGRQREGLRSRHLNFPGCKSRIFAVGSSTSVTGSARKRTQAEQRHLYSFVLRTARISRETNDEDASSSSSRAEANERGGRAR